MNRTTSQNGAAPDTEYSTVSHLKIIVSYGAALFTLYATFNPWPNILLISSICILFAFFFQVMKRKFVAAALIPIFSLWILELTSGYFVNSLQWVDEAGFYVPLSNRYFFLLILYFYFIATSLILLPNGKVRETSAQEYYVNYVDRKILVCILLISYGGALFILSTYLRLGFPFLDGKDRLEFSADSQIFTYIMRYRVTVFLLLGVYFSKTGSRAVAGAAILYIVLAVLGADRVTYPLMMISFFFVGYALQREDSHISKSLLILSVIGMTLIIYFFIESRPGATFNIKIDSFARRISLQGQTWALATMTDYPLWDIQGNRVIKELQNLAFSSSYEQWQDPLLGAWHFMMKYLPKTDTIWWRMENNNTMIMAFYPYVLEVYGLFPLIIINCMFPILIAYAAHHLLRSIRNLDFISILLLGMILQGYTFAVITADFGQIVGRWPVIFWSLYFVRRFFFINKPVRRSRLASQ